MVADLITGNSISANPKSSFNMRGGEKPWREGKKNIHWYMSSKIKVSSISKVDTEDLTLYFEFDYLRALFGPGEGTKLNYNILTLSNEYHFISLSQSVAQDKTSMLCPHM